MSEENVQNARKRASLKVFTSEVSIRRQTILFKIKRMELSRLFQSRTDARLEQFQHIMELAKQLAGSNPGALRDLIKVLLRPLQASLMVSVIERREHEANSEIKPWNFFWAKNTLLFFLARSRNPCALIGLRCAWRRMSSCHAPGTETEQPRL